MAGGGSDSGADDDEGGWPHRSRRPFLEGSLDSERTQRWWGSLKEASTSPVFPLPGDMMPEVVTVSHKALVQRLA